MKKLIKISDCSTFAKDQKSGAVVNIDNDAYHAALQRKQHNKQGKLLMQKIEELEKRITYLEEHINKQRI
jgi:hypothetical protein